MNIIPRLHPPELLIILALALIPLLVWLEKAEPAVWFERLFTPDSAEGGPRHQPLVTEGVFLPPVITKDTTLTGDTPLLLAGTVKIPEGVTLQIESGTTVYVHEYGQLVVEGTFNASGTAENPVSFTTNETHIANRTWSGIVFTPQSTGTLTYTTIRHASPAVTCEEESVVTIDHATISLGNLGIYTESPQCRIQNSEIKHVTTGGIGSGLQPFITNTTIQAEKEDIDIFQ